MRKQKNNFNHHNRYPLIEKVALTTCSLLQLIILLSEAREICVKNYFSWELCRYHHSTVTADLNGAQSVRLEK